MELAQLWRNTNNTSEPELQTELLFGFFPQPLIFALCSNLGAFNNFAFLQAGGPLSNTYWGGRGWVEDLKFVANVFSTPCLPAAATKVWIPLKLIDNKKKNNIK